MKTPIFIPAFVLFLAPLARAETTLASFNGAVPNTPGWQIVGGVPLNVIEDEGRKAIEFKDDSDTDSVALVYRLTEEEAIEMVSRGCTFEARIRHISNGPSGTNFRLLMRIPGYGSAQISTYHDANNDSVRLNIYDSVKGENIGLALPGNGRVYVTVSGVFRPGATFEGPGSLEIFIDGKSTATIGLGRGSSPRAQIEIGGIGGSAVARTSHNLITDFRLTTP